MATLVGKPAPKFKAQAVVNGAIKEVSLDDNKGKWTLLFFYPLDFTFVCPTEIIGYGDKLAEFQKRGVEVVGCSIDSQYSHKAWVETPRNKGGIAGVTYPILADVTKSISRDYGVLDEAKGIALRGTFIINPEGVIKTLEIHDNAIARDVKETLRKLKAAQYVANNPGQVCPAKWNEGSATITPSLDLVGKI